jgi:hypothetical protein
MLRPGPLPTYIAIRLALDLADDAKGAMAYRGVSIGNIQSMPLRHGRVPIFSSTSYLSSSGMMKVVLCYYAGNMQRRYAVVEGMCDAAVLVGAVGCMQCLGLVGWWSKCKCLAPCFLTCVGPATHLPCTPTLEPRPRFTHLLLGPVLSIAHPGPTPPPS